MKTIISPLYELVFFVDLSAFPIVCSSLTCLPYSQVSKKSTSTICTNIRLINRTTKPDYAWRVGKKQQHLHSCQILTQKKFWWFLGRKTSFAQLLCAQQKRKTIS